MKSMTGLRLRKEMIRIALDLELEQPNTNHQVDDSLLDEEKIIQVGWCVFNDEPFEILKERCLEVNIKVPLSTFIKGLTGITDKQIFDGTTLIHIYNMLYYDRNFYDTSRVIVQWGSGDMQSLQNELEFEGLLKSEWEFGRSGRNAKHLFQDYCNQNGISPNGGLKKSMNKLGLKFEGKTHNALTDAINTARIYSYLINKLKEDK